jgi:hypothetical protein
MNDAAADSRQRDPWGWLPDRLAPRPQSLDDPAGPRLWRAETIVLVLAFAFLATATINDLVRQGNINHRLIADLRTWRTYTHHDYKNVEPNQQLLGPATKRDVVCGNTEPGPPKERTQICLVVTGPTVDGMRTVAGGWYLPPNTIYNTRSLRYGCFGSITMGMCPR